MTQNILLALAYHSQNTPYILHACLSILITESVCSFHLLPFQEVDQFLWLILIEAGHYPGAQLFMVGW